MEKLFNTYADRLFSIAYKIVGDRDSAKDITQEAFIRFGRANPSLPNEAAVSAYLTKTVINLAYNEQRNQKTRLNKESEINHSMYSDKNTGDPSEILTRQKVSKALNRLPDKQREAITCRFFGEMTIAEITEQMHITAGSVKTHIKRGLIKLKEMLSASQRENLYEL